MSKTNNGATLSYKNQLWTPAEIEDDGITFEEKMTEITVILIEQLTESSKLENGIKKNLLALEFEV